MNEIGTLKARERRMIPAVNVLAHFHLANSSPFLSNTHIHTFNTEQHIYFELRYFKFSSTILLVKKPLKMKVSAAAAVLLINIATCVAPFCSNKLATTDDILTCNYAQKKVVISTSSEELEYELTSLLHIGSANEEDDWYYTGKQTVIVAGRE